MFTPLRFLRKWREKSELASRGTVETRLPLSDEQVRVIWIAASWLIDYPGSHLYDRLGDISALIAGAGLPDGAGDELAGVVESLRDADVYTLRSEYVETFDTRRRGCLYLTYFANGDTRRRGKALLEIKETYRAAGLDVSDDELPDHLAYVLEFGAGHDMYKGAQILLANRAGIELLRLHLTDIDSPWAGVLRAVCGTLPALDGDDVGAVRRLAEEGPAEELVGIDDGLGGYGDGSENMPPANMSPYATASSASCSAPGHGGSPDRAGVPTPGRSRTAFIPLGDVKGPRS